MIIVKIIGGLGNQLFQYAIGKNLAQKNKTGLYLDIEGFKTYTKHKYSLNHFRINENFASEKETKKFRKFGANGIEGKIFTFLEELKPLSVRRYIKEPASSRFCPEILNLKDNIYLDGFWQNEKYFKDIEKIIRDEIIPKNPVSNELLDLIKSASSIAIHVRRTDYITNPTVNKLYGTCSTDYYQKAMENLISKIKNPHFFIFSDDIEWSKENIKSDFPMTFIEHGPEKNYEDLILMSKCRHNIIANSSFSWWGAWLNQNPDKIIIAPKKKFKDESKNSKDFYPESWITI